jgi:hypothetical protein
MIVLVDSIMQYFAYKFALAYSSQDQNDFGRVRAVGEHTLCTFPKLFSEQTLFRIKHCIATIKRR